MKTFFFFSSFIYIFLLKQETVVCKCTQNYHLAALCVLHSLSALKKNEICTLGCLCNHFVGVVATSEAWLPCAPNAAPEFPCEVHLRTCFCAKVLLAKISCLCDVSYLTVNTEQHQNKKINTSTCLLRNGTTQTEDKYFSRTACKNWNFHWAHSKDF